MSNQDHAMTAIGLMSGTSMDGVDAAMLRTDGVRAEPLGPALERPYRPEERDLLKAAIKAAAGLQRTGPRPAVIGKAAAMVVAAHAEAVESLLAKAGTARGDVDIVGFHGQTVLHRPAEAWTWQIGDGAALAAATGIDVVSRFRQADLAAGGEGAPFAPLYHQALAARSCLAPPWAVLNLGGVGNVTYLGADGRLLAFDTGPGNALIDDWMLARTGRPMDEDGGLAARGRVDQAVLGALMQNAYFGAAAPKSLDRNDFSAGAAAHLSDADGAATLAAFTVEAVRAALDHLPQAPQSWVVCGGGRHNARLMRLLAERLDAKVMSAEAAGWRGDAIEAEAFAFLAVRSLRGLPLSEPGTTGVPAPLTGGVLHRAAGR